MQENDWIQRFVIQPLTKSQQFVMNILCGIITFFKILPTVALKVKNKVVINVQEYYEQRLEKDRKRISNLEQQNQMLLKENKTLKAQAVALRQEKSYLSTKVKAANNMLRILTKTKEDVNSCKTPVKINVRDVDHLLQKKLNEPTDKVSNNKKTVHVKSQPPITVIRKKEVKKVALPKVNENLSSVKRTLEKDTPKQKEVCGSTLKKSPKILPTKIPMPEKSVILFRGKGKVVESGTLRITSKPKGTGKTEQKGVLVDGQAKVKSMKHVEPKKDAKVKVQKNFNETFVVER